MRKRKLGINVMSGIVAIVSALLFPGMISGSYSFVVSGISFYFEAEEFRFGCEVEFKC